MVVKILSSLFVLLIAIGSVSAQDSVEDALRVIDETKFVPLYETNPEALTEFDEKTIYIKRFPDEEDGLSYQIRLPKDWLVTNKANLKYESVANQIIGDIAEYISPNNPLGRAKITVRSNPIFRDVFMKDLFLSQTLAEGTSIRSLEAVGLKEIESEFVRQEEGDALVFRSRGFMFGPRYIYVDFAVPVRRYNDLKDLQAYVINSFEFLSEPKGELEAKNTFAFINERKMQYPEGLELTSKKVHSRDHFSVRFLNKDISDFPNGALRFDVYRKRDEFDITKTIEETKAEFSNIEQSVSDLIETKEYELNDIITKSTFEVFAIKERLSKFEEDKLGRIKNELLFATLKDDEFYYVATVLTPTRKNNLLEWSRNMRAFEIMVESIQLIPTSDVFPPVVEETQEAEEESLEESATAEEEGANSPPESEAF